MGWTIPVQTADTTLGIQPVGIDASSVGTTTDGLDLVIGSLREWLAGLIALLPNMLAALVVVGVFALLSRVVSRVVSRSLGRTAMADAVVGLVAKTVGVAVVAIGLFFALGLLHLDKTVTSLLAGAGVIGLALAFAFQDMAANFVAGLYMSVNRPFEIGHVVETNDVIATVEEIGMRATVLRTGQGQIVRMPNKIVFEKTLVNYSQSGERRVDVELGVSYGEDLDRVRTVAMKAIRQLPECDPERDAELLYTGFGDSAINLVVRFWVNFRDGHDYFPAQDAAIVAIKRAFEAEKIVIPYPVRTLDFSIKGGGRLRDELAATGKLP